MKKIESLLVVFFCMASKIFDEQNWFFFVNHKIGRSTQNYSRGFFTPPLSYYIKQLAQIKKPHLSVRHVLPKKKPIHELQSCGNFFAIHMSTCTHF